MPLDRWRRRLLPGRARHEQTEKEDGGRDLSWFYIDVEGGYQYVGLETFDVDVELDRGFIKNEAAVATLVPV